MASIRIFSRAVLAVLALGAAWVRSESVGKEYQLGEFSVTEHVSGPGVDLGRSGGKLTVLYYWGMRCAPCMETLPKLVKLDEAYRDQGLVIVGIHAASGDVEEIRRVCKEQKVRFPVYRSYKTPDGMAVGILPRVMMFDGKGNLVFNGHHSAIIREIEGRFKRKAPTSRSDKSRSMRSSGTSAAPR